MLALIGRPRPRSSQSGAQAAPENGASEEPLGVTFTNTERIDFAILTIVFGVLVGAISAFSILINQIVRRNFRSCVPLSHANSTLCSSYVTPLAHA